MQPQPDFQEREARKKRKLRRNKDSLAFDLTALKKRLEIISLEENEPDKIGSCGSISSDQGSESSESSGRVKSDCSESDKKSDIGYNSGRFSNYCYQLCSDWLTKLKRFDWLTHI